MECGIFNCRPWHQLEWPCVCLEQVFTARRRFWTDHDVLRKCRCSRMQSTCRNNGRSTGNRDMVLVIWCYIVWTGWDVSWHRCSKVCECLYARSLHPTTAGDWRDGRDFCVPRDA